MSVKVRIPTQLRSVVGGKSEIEVEADSVKAMIGEISSQYPELATRMLDEQGNLRRFVNLFVRDEDIRFLDGLDTELNDGDVVSVVPAVAGGQ
jgi:molybdopterin synthase sulfur carrier subunit